MWSLGPGIGQQAVVQHDPPDGLPGDLVGAQALELAVDVAVAPRRVLLGHLEHQLADHVGLGGRRPPTTSGL